MNRSSGSVVDERAQKLPLRRASGPGPRRRGRDRRGGLSGVAQLGGDRARLAEVDGCRATAPGPVGGDHVPDGAALVAAERDAAAGAADRRYASRVVMRFGNTTPAYSAAKNAGDRSSARKLAARRRDRVAPCCCSFGDAAGRPIAAHAQHSLRRDAARLGRRGVEHLARGGVDAGDEDTRLAERLGDPNRGLEQPEVAFAARRRGCG